MSQKLPDALSLVIRTLLGASERSLPNEWNREDTEAHDHACFLIGDTYSKTPADDRGKRGLLTRLWQRLKN